MMEPLLESFGVSPADMIGAGGEAKVYALGEDRVLRLCHGEATEFLQKRRAFYEMLQEHDPSFEAPFIIDQGEIEGRSYTIEKRMRGRVCTEVLRGLTGVERETALTNYLWAVDQISEIRFPDALYGELLTDDPVQSESWPGFLQKRIETTLQGSRTYVEEDFPCFGEVEAYYLNELRLFEGITEKRLVHGDYFPGNAYMDDDLTLCGVGDFSIYTAVGDPRMDFAAAVIYMEVIDITLPEDYPFLRRLLAERWGTQMERILHFYRLYYSVYFTAVKDSDPDFYGWCIENFRAHLDGFRR